VLPATTEQAAVAVGKAAAYGVPVFPQGGNTGLCYGAVPSGSSGILLALSRLNRIRTVDRRNSSLVCDAGAVLAKVHEAAGEVGRQFPLHLGSEGSAQIGGLISTNAGGTGVLRYGAMRDLVLGLEVVLADGRIWNGLTALRKDNTAYDLKHFFIGAEGTLGVVTGAALKLSPAMRARADAWVAVRSPQNALDLLGLFQDVFDTRIQAFELLSASEVEIAVVNVPGNRIPFSSSPPWSVLIELGDTDAESPLTSRLETTLSAAMEAGTVEDAVIAQSETQAASFWRLRHTLSEANKRHGMSHTHDVSVPVGSVPAFIDAADRMLEERFPQAVSLAVSHLGDGNVHYIAMYSHEQWAAVTDPDATVQELQTAVHDIAACFGGSFSAEHGIGRKLVGELQRLTEPLELEMLRAVKRSFDPENRLNPGVIF
jgi:FAD/FMN-containing dehydrogenase